jgi:hypothetical protein
MSDVNAPEPSAGARPNDAEHPVSAERASTDTASEPTAPHAESPPVSVEHAASAERTSTYAAVHEDPARHRDKVIGTIIVAAAFIVSLGISLWAKHASRPEVSEPPGPPTREGIAGYPSKVDPVASLAGARALTKRAMLRGFVAEGVKSDGTVDLSEGPGRVRYAFQSPPGQGPQPPREPGTLPKQHYCGKQTVHLRKEGLVADPDRADAGCPPRHIEPLPDPECSIGKVWQHALARGAPGNRFARVEYYRSNAGPAWKFDISGTKHQFELYGDCQRELVGDEAQSYH